MKKLLLSAVLSLAVALMAVPSAQATSAIVVPSQFIDGSTNTLVLAGTNATVSIVPALSTNYYNIYNTPNNTNYWPSIAAPPPFNTIPWRFLSVCAGYTNILTNSITVRWAGTTDYSHWVSNVWSFSISNTASVVQTPMMTNFDSQGIVGLSLQAIENPGATNATGFFMFCAPKATSP